jgi:hypothetical protein
LLEPPFSLVARAKRPVNDWLLSHHHPNGRSGGDSLRQKRLQVIVTWYVFESAHGLPSNLPTDIRRQQGFFRADFH